MITCGEPRTGIHSYRVFDFAIVDIVLSLLLAALVSYLTKLSPLLIVPSIFILGIIVHKLLKIDTKLNVMLFGVSS